MIVTPDRLNNVMEFDHVIRVHDDGTVSEPRDVWAPELWDDHLDTGGKPWTLMTGYSSQDRYAGPVMHNSESIGGQMALDILATPGLYVAIVANWTEECPGHESLAGSHMGESVQCDGSCEPGDAIEGWAVACIVDPTV